MVHSQTLEIKKTPYARVKIDRDSLKTLKAFVKTDRFPYATIFASTGLRRNTVNSLIDRGDARLEHKLLIEKFTAALES